MGYIAHNAIIVTGYDPKRVEAARQKAAEVFDARQVSSIVTGVVNSYDSFLVGPDGSKEGWSDSNEGDERRNTFLTWLRAEWKAGNYLEWVELRYGDEEELSAVTDNGLMREDDEDEHPAGNAPTLG